MAPSLRGSLWIKTFGSRNQWQLILPPLPYQIPKPQLDWGQTTPRSPLHAAGWGPAMPVLCTRSGRSARFSPQIDQVLLTWPTGQEGWAPLVYEMELFSAFSDSGHPLQNFLNVGAPHLKTSAKLPRLPHSFSTGMLPPPLKPAHAPDCIRTASY